jgi:hypothetical protein
MSFHTKCWMNDLAFLRDRPLREIVIPGSHDAGTYKLYYPVDNNSSKCQQVSVLEQLRAGSRYLDLRAWKASDNEYWMYHGLAWSDVKLVDVLTDIKTFLTESTGEVVIATLLIDVKTGIDEGWNWACDQVRDHRATTADLQGKSFGDVTVHDLCTLGKRLVLLRSGDASQLQCMDREGVYGDSLYPQTYLDKLDEYHVWSDRLWILHLGIPYKGDIHNTMNDRAGWNATEFIPRFKGTGTHANWLTRRLNIINVDFVEQFGWVDAIVRLNGHYPKNWPPVVVPEVQRSSFWWKLKAINKNGTLHIHAETSAPFRAQQGQIHVYRTNGGFPDDPEGKAEEWCWDNDAHDWDTGLKWTSGMPVAWVAEKAPNGPYVLFLTLVTDAPTTEAQKTFTWTLRSGSGATKMLLEGVSDAPFRAQQGQLHVYKANSQFPANPDGHAEQWKWDNESHPWNTDLTWTAGRRVAWVAEKSPNGPQVLFVKHTTR